MSEPWRDQAEEPGAGGRWRFESARPRVGPAPDLLSAVRELLAHTPACRCCDELAPRRATRQVRGHMVSGASRQSAVVLLCDVCEPPDAGVFARYEWFAPIDLPHAAALRRVLELVGI